MKCEEVRERLLDVLYFEEEDPWVVYRFHRHLAECPLCDEEYRELLAVRRDVAAWATFEASREEAGTRGAEPAGSPWAWRRWGQALIGQVLPAAAAVLVGLLLFTAGQRLGWFGSLSPEAAALEAGLHRVVVAAQQEQLNTIGQALLDLKEEMILRDRAVLEEVYGDLLQMEQRYRTALEDTPERLRRLTSQ
ncbi:MAG: hypothetical protein Kow00109_05420 [Acidobacteriota bacterium]